MAAFEALSAITPQMIKETVAFVKPPPALLAVLEGVCVLVGEDPGWVVARNLLKRRDFIPALALSSVENIPFPRIRKASHVGLYTCYGVHVYVYVCMCMCM